MRPGMIIAATAAALLSTTWAFAESRTFKFEGFDRIDIATGLDAVVTQGESFSVTATSNSGQALENLQLEVRNGVLTARLDQSFLDFIVSGGLVGLLLSNGNAVTIDITMPALAAIEASSGADVQGAALVSDDLSLTASSGANIELSDLEAGAVRIESSSGSDVEISGRALSVTAEASSGADIDAEGLVADSVRARASSGANLSVHATSSLDAEASSGGDIDVYGSPTQRNVDASSGGDVNFDD